MEHFSSGANKVFFHNFVHILNGPKNDSIAQIVKHCGITHFDKKNILKAKWKS